MKILDRIEAWLTPDPYTEVREGESWTIRPDKPSPSVNVSGVSLISFCAVVLMLRGC